MGKAVKRHGKLDSRPTKITAVVLAAGSSSRMGRPKPLVPILGKTLLDRVLGGVRDSHVAEIVVVLGSNAKQIQSEIDLQGTTVVMNPQFDDGMSSSLRRGVAAASSRSRGLLVVLGDQPFVSPKSLNALIAQHTSGTGKILIPTFEGIRGNPILLDQALIPELGQIKGDIGCRAIFPGHLSEVIEVAVPDPGVLIDVDTPEELKQIERTLGGHSTPTPAQLSLLVADRVAVHREGPVRALPRFRSRPEVPGPATELERAGKPFALNTTVSAQPRLLVVGEAPVAKALAALGGFLGLGVTVVAPGARATDFPDGVRWEPDLERLGDLVTPGTYVVVASTGMYDESALRSALPKSPRYVGLVASRGRAKAVFDTLRAGGLPKEQLDRVHSPAGIDIAAREPEEIALSIVSEITQVRRTLPPETAEPSPSLEPAAESPSIDPICGVEVESSSPLRTTYRGALYLFCSEGCLEKFKRAPKQYAVV